MGISVCWTVVERQRSVALDYVRKRSGKVCSGISAVAHLINTADDAFSIPSVRRTDLSKPDARMDFPTVACIRKHLATFIKASSDVRLHRSATWGGRRDRLLPSPVVCGNIQLVDPYCVSRPQSFKSDADTVGRRF